jgi:hypothetical protein
MERIQSHSLAKMKEIIEMREMIQEPMNKARENRRNNSN